MEQEQLDLLQPPPLPPSFADDDSRMEVRLKASSAWPAPRAAACLPLPGATTRRRVFARPHPEQLVAGGQEGHVRL